MTYTARKPPLPTPIEELSSRIPGWGVDRLPADRPSVPRLRSDLDSGAHWEVPEPQEERQPRERSIEHAMLTPVFGTACPLHGFSGMIRRFAYRRFSEARAAHWLLLIAGDRIDVLESRVVALLNGRPDNPLGTGLGSEVSHHGFSSRFRKRRADVWLQLLDPLLVIGPWILGVLLCRRLLARRRRVR